MTGTRWSVVIPAFDEARRLPPYLDDVIASFEGRGETCEVAVVDDAATNDTPAVVEARAREVASVNWADQRGSKVGVPRHGPGKLLRIVTARLRMGMPR